MTDNSITMTTIDILSTTFLFLCVDFPNLCVGLPEVRDREFVLNTTLLLWYDYGVHSS